MGGVRLRHGLRERHKPLGFARQGRSVAPVAVQAEAASARRLANDEDIHLTVSRRVRCLGVESEARRSLGISVSVGRALNGKPKIIEHVDRIQVQLGTVITAGGIAHAERNNARGSDNGRNTPLKRHERRRKPRPE